MRVYRVQLVSFRIQRIKAKQIYNDTKLDDEIEGKRTFCVEEKLHDEKFNYKLSDFLLELEGKGSMNIRLQ